MRPGMAYPLSFAALVAALLLRWALDPVMGDALPLVTLFGAVAAAVWVGGWRPAVFVALAGYVACDYLFIPPRGTIRLETMGNIVGLVAYAFTCGLMIIIGEEMRRARNRAREGRELLQVTLRSIERDRAGQLLTARLLAAIVESSDDAIISKSLDGVIQSWNAGAERIFGYPADEAIGRHISLVIPPDRIAEEDHIIANLKAGRRIERFETERVRKDGRRIPISLTVSPIRDEAGAIVGASKIAHDISERKLAEDNLRRLAGDLAQADRRKDEFLATLAHELRNPLAPLSNMLEVLRRADTDAGTRSRALGTMQRQLAQMVRLVDDLLDLNRISHDRLELRQGEVELSTIVHQAVEATRPLLDAAGHRLTLSLPKDPVWLRADPARLAQVLGNLLTNSAKYTNPGGHIAITAWREDGEAVVSVKDNGTGIPPDKLDSIFDMFAQIDRSLERAQGGLGIGLTLVKRLVEMHGGTIAVKSEGEDSGSEFIVRLPALAQRPATAVAGPEAHLPSTRRRILIADDNKDSAESLALLLSITGHETFVANDGVEALKAAERRRPDVMLLDIGMPNMSGYDVCRRARAAPWGEHIVTIALTGWGQEEDRRKSHDAGFDGHLVKPVDYAALEELLASLAERGEVARSS